MAAAKVPKIMIPDTKVIIVTIRPMGVIGKRQCHSAVGIELEVTIVICAVETARLVVGETRLNCPYRIRIPALEQTARLDALAALMAVLDDTCVLHRAGPAGLAAMQTGARRVLAVGGTATPAGRAALADLDHTLTGYRASPGGAADLLAATVFIDRLAEHAAATATGDNAHANAIA